MYVKEMAIVLFGFIMGMLVANTILLNKLISHSVEAEMRYEDVRDVASAQR